MAVADDRMKKGRKRKEKWNRIECKSRGNRKRSPRKW